jgi:ATP-dependent DNA helicase RecG
MMNQQQLVALLNSLLTSWESEVVEFKQASEDYETDRIGEYFSSLSNEANLRGLDRAWLVFGINDKTRDIVGSRYRLEPDRLQSLKGQIAQGTEPSVTLRDIYQLTTANGRVVLFEIPAAPRGIPIAWKGHYYARAGESQTSLGLDKLDEIRRQTITQDWSAQVVPEASLADLDEAAIRKARESFAQKHGSRQPLEDIMSWPLASFLERLRLTSGAKLTRASLLLLGKAEAARYLLPHPAQLTWSLEGAERAYEHFGIPFLLNTTKLYQRIRNIQLRILPQDELVPLELPKYDQRIVLEALHNCIAHQDYVRSGRIVVTEYLDRLVFENEGSFFEGQPSDYVQGHKTPRRYRNPCLAQAMTELNMIDTMGYGIRDMYTGQARRYFPLPDYELVGSDAVRLTIHGGVVDIAYSRLLMQKTDLPLEDVLALDRVQKKLPIPDIVASRLKRAGLIEGRKPNWHVSALIADATAAKADYIRTRRQDDAFYAKLFLDYLAKFGKASRAEVEELLLPKLSDALTQQQKADKLGNLLTKLRRQGRIRNTGTRSRPIWQSAE